MKNLASRIIAHRYFPAVALAITFAAAFVVSAIAARQQVIPNLLPDEMFYGKLAQGIAFGDGRQWRGSNYGLPPLWPSILSLAWHSGSPPDGYSTAKTLGAALASSTVLPVWLLARSYVSPRLALIPAALAVMGVWMQVTDFIASENLAYPLATASLAMTVMAVRDVRLRWIAGSVFFAAMATLTRTQMLVLPVILVVALLLDVVRQPGGERRARIAARPRVVWVGLTTAVAAVLLAFVVSPNLTNYDVLGHHASIGKILSTTAHEGIDSIAFFAFIPVVAAVSLMTSVENWRDEKIGALLVTIVAAVVTLYPLLGRFLAWATLGIPVDRYTMYLAPLLLTALVVAPGRIGRWRTVGAALAVAATMFFAPNVGNFVEQGGVYGLQKALFDNGILKGHLETGVIIVGFVVSLLGALALTSRRRAPLGLALTLAVIAGVMVAQNWAARSYEHRYANANRLELLPPQLDWVDRYATAPVATMDIAKNIPLRANAIIYTEFFNKNVKWYYSTIASGNGSCDIDIARDGTVRHGDNRCKGWPTNWVLAEGPVTMTLRRQRVLATSGRSGTLVEAPPGAPHIQSLVGPPCTSYGCTGQFEMALYLDKPSQVTVTFGPGRVDHQIQLGEGVRTLKAGEPVTLHFNLKAGPQSGNFPVDWTDPSDAPPLQSVIVTTDTKSIKVF